MVYNLALHRPNRDDPPLILVGVQGRYAFIDPMSKQQPVTRDIQDPDHSTFMFDVVGGVKGRDDKVSPPRTSPVCRCVCACVRARARARACVCVCARARVCVCAAERRLAS